MAAASGGAGIAESGSWSSPSESTQRLQIKSAGEDARGHAGSGLPALVERIGRQTGIWLPKMQLLQLENPPASRLIQAR
jgi:hypothetical protein